MSHFGRFPGVRGAPGGASRGPTGGGGPPAAGLRRAARTRGAAGAAGARADPAADGPGPRGVPAARRQEQRHLGRPAALLLRRRPRHARHPGRTGAAQGRAEAGGGRHRQELDEACAVIEPPADNVLAVHEALEELEERDPLKAQIVLLRYFTGLTMDETAAVLGLAERTLDRQWRYIRAWLLKRLS